MADNNIKRRQDITAIQRKLGLLTYRATAGDASGTLWEDAGRGLVRVRRETSNGFSAPQVVPLHDQALFLEAGRGVLLGYRQDVLGVVGIDRRAQVAAGANVGVNAGNSPDITDVKQLRQDAIITGKSTPLAQPALEVAIDSWFRIIDGTASMMNGTRVNLQPHLPSAGNHLLAGLWLNTDNTVSVTTSTEQSQLDPLLIEDVVEVVNSRPKKSDAVWCWQLIGNMTEITDTHSFLDMRSIVGRWTDTAEHLPLYTDATLSSPPTDAQLDTLLGQPSAVLGGYSAFISDGTNVNLVMSDAASWHYVAMTKAT